MKNQVFYSSFEEISNNGCTGLTATYWNNMDLKGDVAAIQQFTSPINLSNSGYTAFNTSVGLFNFTASYEGVFRPKKSDDYTLIIEGDDGYRVILLESPFLSPFLFRWRRQRPAGWCGS